MTPSKFIATLAGVGLLRPAPGTWGSAVVLPCTLLGPLWCLGLAALLTLVGLWAVARLPERAEDPGWVVVDEGAGQLLALAALAPGAGWPWVVVAFGLFRLFDVLKPGPVGWADQQKGAVGVMLDDVVAGAMAAGVLGMLRGAM